MARRSKKSTKTAVVTPPPAPVPDKPAPPKPPTVIPDGYIWDNSSGQMKKNAV